MWKNEEAHKETKATSTLLSILRVRESRYKEGGGGGLFEFVRLFMFVRVFLETTGENLSRGKGVGGDWIEIFKKLLRLRPSFSMFYRLSC